MRTDYQRRRDAKEHKAWLFCRSLKENDLYALLENNDSVIRYAAARRLQTPGSDATVAHAKNLCHHKNYRTREIGCFILGQIKNADCNIPDLMAFLDACAASDTAAIVRAAAIIAMGHMCLKHDAEISLWPILAKRCTLAANSPFVSVREAVAFALINPGDGSMLPVLIKLLRDKNGEVRSWAGCAINGNGYDTPELHHIFSQMLMDEHGGARYEAEEWFAEHPNVQQGAISRL